MASGSRESCSPLLHELEQRLRDYEGVVHGDRELKKRSLRIDLRRNSNVCTCKQRDCTGALSKDNILDARETYWGFPSERPKSSRESERIDSAVQKRSH